jgi:hypothetical protein
VRITVPPRVVAAYVAVTVGVAALGVWLGSQPHQQRALPPVLAVAPPDSTVLQKWHEWHDSLAQAFHDEVVGIEVCQPFPASCALPL